MVSILKRLAKAENEWGLKSLIVSAIYEFIFLIKHPKFKYLFVVEPQDLDIKNEDKKTSSPYIPTPYYFLIVSLKQLKRFLGNFEDSIFIDIGCGTGRALYCSSTFGFSLLIGIEHSKKLNELCNKNLKKYLPPHVKMEIINHNIKDIDFPELISSVSNGRKVNSLVFFLFTPFKDVVFDIFLNKINEMANFDCFIVYFGPQNEKMIIEKGFLLSYANYFNKDTPIKIYQRKRIDL
jgi:SAM-dependent methyltransferase